MRESKGRLDSLQALRALAAVLVVIHHTAKEHPLYFTNPSAWQPLYSGWFGVDIFFVLSGYLIYRIHNRDLGHPDKLGSYAWKRFSRVFPPLWVAATIILGGLLLRQIRAGGVGSIWEHSETNPVKIALNYILWPQPDRPYPVTWTLTYEVWFYTLMGLLFFLPAKAGRAFLAVYALVIAGLWIAGFSAEGWPGVILGRYVIEFLAGVGIAELARRSRPIPVWVGLALAVIGTAITFARPSESVGLVALGAGVGAVGLLSASVRAEEEGKLRVPRWLVWLGNASYSIYLIHNVGITLAHSLLNRWYPRGQSALPVPLQVLPVLVGIVAGIVFHLVAEAPLLRLMQRRRHTPANPATDPA